MKITLGSFSLADGGDASPVGLRINGRYQVQTSGFLRAAASGIFPRGNQVNTITFACTREHASYAAASAFLITHAATMPTGGTLTVATEAWEGTVTKYTAAASAVEARDGTQEGVTTTHQYTILCGAFAGGSLGLNLPVGGGSLGGTLPTSGSGPEEWTDYGTPDPTLF